MERPSGHYGGSSLEPEICHPSNRRYQDARFGLVELTIVREYDDAPLYRAGDRDAIPARRPLGADPPVLAAWKGLSLQPRQRRRQNWQWEPLENVPLRQPFVGR
jgi:hypothetical protein